MKRLAYLSVVLLMAILGSCTKGTVKAGGNPLVGMWRQDGNSFDEAKDSSYVVHLKEDGTFVFGSYNDGKLESSNEGKWHIDAAKGLIYVARDDSSEDSAKYEIVDKDKVKLYGPDGEKVMLYMVRIQ